MEPTIDKSALIADLLAAIKELENTPASDKRRRDALSHLIAQNSYNLLFMGKSAPECLELIDKLKALVKENAL